MLRVWKTEQVSKVTYNPQSALACMPKYNIIPVASRDFAESELLEKHGRASASPFGLLGTTGELEGAVSLNLKA